MKSKKYLALMLVVALGLLLAACGAGKKAAATAAIKAAEDAYNAVKTELMQYVPDEATAVEEAITGAKDNFTQNNFDAAIEAVKGIPDKIAELSALAATKKEELTKAWGELSGGMPQVLETIKSRLDVLMASKKLPAGLDKAKLDLAKTGYETASNMWNEANDTFNAGNVADAMANAKTVQEKAVEVMTTLGMQIPAALTKS
jgi:hypothetical protein